MPGLFVISLDFELYWGRFDKIELSDTVKKRLLNTRLLITEQLNIFVQSQIHATWATVGMLFNKTEEQWLINKPSLLPVFTNSKRSAYNDFAAKDINIENRLFYFAPDIIHAIAQTHGQEVGSHTYAHYYCLEDGGTKEQFSADLKAAKKIAADNQLQLRSLVFPRNQYNDEYLSVCAAEGIVCVRTNPPVWYWRPTSSETMLRKLFRFTDAYNFTGVAKTYTLQQLGNKPNDLPLQLPASRLLRPWQAKYPLLNKLKMKRIKEEMTEAAKTGSYYHLWWHPENFGDDPEECLTELKEIVQHYQFLKQAYQFMSCNMHEATQLLIN